MRVTIAVHHFPPRYRGGAELRAYRTASWLRDHGAEVSVVCVEDIARDGAERLTYLDDVHDGVPVRRLSFNMLAAPDPFRWSYDNPWIGEHMRQYLAETEPDVLHLISGYLMSGSTLRAAAEAQRADGRRIRSIVSLTDFWFLCPRITLLRSNGELCAPPFDAVTCARCLGEEKRRYRITGSLAPGLMRAFWRRRTKRVRRVEARMAFLRETLGQVDVLISPSRFLCDLFVQAGLSREKIVFSRQGRDFDLEPELLRKTPAGHLRIGYMGQIAPHKGVHTLFQAAQRLVGVDLEIKVYGDETHFPAYSRTLKQMARGDPRLGLNGLYEQKDVSRVLQDLDVVVVPSLWYENSPNTILEAFAHRTPVVASALGGMAELVQDGVNGLHFTPGDPKDLAGKLRRLIDDRQLLPRLRAGIAPVKTTAAEMAELMHIYGSLLGEPGPSEDAQ